MAELYEKPPTAYHIDNSGSNAPQLTGDKATDEQLAGLTDEERKQYLEEANAPLTGEDVAQLVAGARETGYRPNNEEVQLYKQWAAKQNHSILQGIAQGFEGIKQVFFSAGQEFIDHPVETGVKLPASVVEGFFQGGRNLYGMLAESQDPNSALFRFKSILTGDGSDPDAERKQFIEAMEFNHHTADIEEGKATVLLDKDLINHKVATASSFIADPMLLVPYVGEVSGVSHAISAGMRAVGVGERIAKISASIGKMQNKIIGGTLKWGVGTPVEFMGGAVRNTIDYGTSQSGRLVEAATGLPMSDWRATVRMSQLGTLGAEAVGIGAVPVVGDISKAHLAGTFAHGAGGAISAIGNQIIEQAEFGRGINSYARQALLDAQKNGIVLTPHAQNLLKVLDKVDPLFSYANTVARGSAHGAMIGAGLGWASGGEEGMYQGIGAGIGLGAIGGTTGRLMSDVTGGTRNARVDIQAKLAIEGWKQVAPDKATAFQILKAKAEAIGPEYANAMNGIIAGVDGVAPNLEAHIMGNKNGEFNNWLREQGYNPETGRYTELSKMYDDYKLNREEKYIVNGILRDNGKNFAGDVEGFKKAMADPANQSKFKDRYNKLSQDAKNALHDALDGHKELITELDKQGTNIKDFYGHHSAAEAVTEQINKYHEQGNMTLVRDKIKEFLDANKNEDGSLTKRGELIRDKLRNEGYLDREGNVLQERGSKNADLTAHEFMMNEGVVIRRESDGKVHMYINTDHLHNSKSIVPHELFHAIFRETAMKSEFMGRWLSEILGEKDANGNYTKKGSVDINELKKFFSKYIDIDSSETDKVARKAMLDKAIENHQRGLAGETISDKTTPPLEHFAEEFGAYYYSHWLLSKPNDYLFRGGELTGIRGIMERVKDGWLDYWEGEMKSNNPTFDFSKGVDKAFGDDSGRRTRIGSLDYFMRDFTRAVANSNRGTFDPRSMSQQGLKSFVDKNGVYTIGQRDRTGRINPVFNAEYDRANAVAGREIFKILNGLDPKLRTSVVDGEGNITGRLSPDELDAIVKSGHRNRAWADKIKQAYDILDGKGSNVVEYGYFGRTEQIGDYSWPRKTGKDVAFKNRKVILLDVETKIGADGKFYTLFHTLDKAVIEARGDAVWSNPEAKRIWGDRGSMEADFFRYLENASKPEGDPSIKTSAELLEDGTGNGRAKRDFLHQMLGMAMSEGDAYINKPIAEIPYGIRQSVTTFNVDGVSGMRVSNGARYDYNHNNAFKRLSRNWKPSEMTSEKTSSGEIIKHASGWKFVKNSNGTVNAYKSSGELIGKFSNIQEAAKAGQSAYNQINSPKNLNSIEAEHTRALNDFSRSYKPLDDAEYQLSQTYGSVWKIPRMKDFVGARDLIPFTRQEYALNRFYSMTPAELWKYANDLVASSKAELDAHPEYRRLTKEKQIRQDEFRAADLAEYNALLKANKAKDAYKAKQFELSSPLIEELKKITDNKEALAKIKEIDNVANHPEMVELARVQNELDFAHGNSKVLVSDARQKVYDINGKLDEIENAINAKSATTKTMIESLRFKNGDPMQLFHQMLEDEIQIARTGKNSWEKYNTTSLTEMFGHEHDAMFQTGKPFVTVATHGTNSANFAKTLLFDINKAGVQTDCPSARRGAFFGGDQYTTRSTQYSLNQFRGNLYDFWKTFKEINQYDNPHLLTVHNQEWHIKQLNNFYEKVWELRNLDNKAQDGSDVIAKNQFVKDRVNEIMQMPITSAEEHINAIDGDRWAAINDARDYLAKQKDTVDTNDLSSKQIMRTADLLRDNRDSIVRSTNQLFSFVGSSSRMSDADYRNIALKNLRDGQLQLRFAIRMENPKVIFDPRNTSYSEKYLSQHMNKAAAEGHDGIVFQRLRDGGGWDTIYTILNENVHDNVIGLESTLDDRQVNRGDNFKTMKQMNFSWKPVEWAVKDLMNHPDHKGVWDKIFSSGAVVQNFKTKDLEGKPVLNISPDNSFVGSISVGDEQVMKGQGGVLFAVNNLEKGGIWASTDTAAKRMYEAMMTLRNADLAKGGDGTVYITIPKAKSSKIASSENGARGYMNVINQLAKHDIIPREVLQNAIRKAIGTGKDIFGKEVSKVGSSVDIVDRALEAFFSDDNGAFNARGTFVQKLVVEITKANINDPKRVADAQKTFGTKASNILKSKDVLMDAIGKLFDDPLTKNLNEGDVYAVIKVAGDFTLSKDRLHDSYNTSIVHTGGKKPQLLLLDNPRHITEMLDSVKAKDASSDKTGWTQEELTAFHNDINESIDNAKARGKGFAEENEGLHHTSHYGINQTGLAVAKFKDNLSFKPTEEGQGGRTYDQTSRKWKFGFVGRVAHENPELTKGVSIQHIDKGNGFNKLVFTDNSSGQSKNIGQISWDKFGGISTAIDKDYRGRGLSYLFYSEAAERMRAQGIKQAVGTVINKEAIPVKIREAIFGDTRRFISRSEEGKPIGQAEAKAIIQAMQEQGGEFAGVSVSNKIESNKWYKPTEGEPHPSEGTDAKISYLKGLMEKYEKFKDAKGRHNSDNKRRYWDASNEYWSLTQYKKPQNNSTQGGRIYDTTSEQWKREFIGRIAKENPDKVAGLEIKYIENTKLIKGKNLVTLTLHNSEGQQIGILNADVYGDGTAKIVDTQVAQQFSNKGYSKLMLSEFGERVRSQGVTKVNGEVVDALDRPTKARRSVFGNAELDPESFSNISQSGQVTVSKLNKDSYYKPIEGITDWNAEKTSAGSIIKNSAGYVISQMNGKWRVYNPYKVLVGIFDDEQKAKMRVRREAIKQ